MPSEPDFTSSPPLSFSALPLNVTSPFDPAGPDMPSLPSGPASYAPSEDVFSSVIHSSEPPGSDLPLLPSGPASYAPSEGELSTVDTSVPPSDSSDTHPTPKTVTRFGWRLPRAWVNKIEAMPRAYVGSGSPSSDASHEVVAISSSSSTYSSPPLTSSPLSSPSSGSFSEGEPELTPLITSLLKAAGILRPEYEGPSEPSPPSPAATREASPGLDLEQFTVVESQTPRTNQLKEDPSVEILEGALPSTAPILSPLKRKARPDEGEESGGDSPKRKIAKEENESTRMDETPDFVNNDLLLETVAIQDGASNSPKGNIDLTATDGAYAETEITKEEQGTAADGACVETEITKEEQGRASDSPKESIDRTATDGAYVETEITKEQGGSFLKEKASLNIPSLLNPESSGGPQEPTAATIETGEQAPKSAGEDAKHDELPAEQTVGTEGESANISSASGHGHAPAPSEPSPEEVWQKAVTDKSLPEIVQSISRLLLLAVVPKEDAITSIVDEYRATALRLIDDVMTKLKLESPIVLNALQDACRESIATYTSAEQDIADLTKEIEGADISQTLKALRNDRLAEKLATFIGLCEKKLARYSDIDIGEYWKQMQSFPKEKICGDSAGDNGPEDDGPNNDGSDDDGPDGDGYAADCSDNNGSDNDGSGNGGFDNECSGGPSVGGSSRDKVTSDRHSLKPVSADKGSVEKVGDDVGQKLVRKYWEMLRQGNEFLQGPGRASLEMQTQALLLLGARKPKPLSFFERYEQSLDMWINQLKAEGYE